MHFVQYFMQENASPLPFSSCMLSSLPLSLILCLYPWLLHKNVGKSGCWPFLSVECRTMIICSLRRPDLCNGKLLGWMFRKSQHTDCCFSHCQNRLKSCTSSTAPRRTRTRKIHKPNMRFTRAPSTKLVKCYYLKS